MKARYSQFVTGSDLQEEILVNAMASAFGTVFGEE